MINAEKALYAALFLPMKCGYFVSVRKSVLWPTQKLVHLGFEVDSVSSSFMVPAKKREKFQMLRESILNEKIATLNMLQKFVGSCQSLKAAFPASSLFTRQCSLAMKDLSDVAPTPLSLQVLEEITFWRFVDSMTTPIPWRKEQHVFIKLSADSSGFKWGATTEVNGVLKEFGDYWESPVLQMNICVKEAMALFQLLQAVFDDLWDKRVDVLMDNEGLVLAWNGLKATSPELTSVLRQIFLLALEMNFLLHLTWIPSGSNPSDAPSRKIEVVDSKLVPELREEVVRKFGPFSMDLMATPSNVMVDVMGKKLPFFSRFPMPEAKGVNVFAQAKPGGRLCLSPIPNDCIIVEVVFGVGWSGCDYGSTNL